MDSPINTGLNVLGKIKFRAKFIGTELCKGWKEGVLERRWMVWGGVHIFVHETSQTKMGKVCPVLTRNETRFRDTERMHYSFPGKSLDIDRTANAKITHRYKTL